MKNRFVVEQLEPRILLSGDILSQLVPLLTSNEATMMQMEYLQEHPEMRRISASVSSAPSVLGREPLCLVVVDNKDVSITQEGLMQPFANSTAFVGGAVEQQPLFADFSSEYSFTTKEWDALEDGWRNISSMLGETLTAEGFVPGIPFLDGGSKFYGTGDELTNLLQQPLADYGSSYGESVGGLLDVFSKQWSDGDLVVLGKILGGYDAAKHEARFDLTVRIEKSGKSALDFSLLKDENGLNLTVQDQADYKASLTLDLQFGLNVVSDTFFMALPDGSLSIQVESGDLAAQALFPSPAGLKGVSASGDIELNANFVFSSETGRVIGAGDQAPVLTATPVSSGMAINLAFSGADVYQGIESLTVNSSDLFNAASPEISLQGSHLHPWDASLDANLYIGVGDKLSGSGTLSGDVVNDGIVAPGNSPGHDTISSFTQTASGALVMELQGKSVAGTDFDWLEITGDANFGGTLQVSLLNGYKPTVGDTFDIVTFGGTASGIFTNIKGLYGFDSDHYFEVVQSDKKLQLVTCEIIDGPNSSFVTSPGSAQNDTLGMFLNADYLTSFAPSSVSVEGTFAVGSVVMVSGNFIFSSDATRLIALGSHIGGRFGTSDTYIGVTDADFGLVVGKTPLTSRQIAIEVSGALTAQLGSDITLTADSSTILWRESQSALLTTSNKTVNIGALTYTFSADLVNSTSIQELRATGAVLRIAGFITATGDLAFHHAAATLTDSLGATVSADVLTLGASGLSLFAGVDGDSADKMGLTLGGADIALVIVRDQMSARSWTALKGAAQSAAVTGIPDVTLSGSNLAVTVNMKASDGTVIDFSKVGLQVATGVNQSVTLDFTGPIIKASGTFDVGVADFLNLKGSMAFEKKSENLTVRASNGTTSTLAMDILTLGGIGIDAFAGINSGTAEQMGLVLAGTKFAILMAQEQTGKKRKWSAVKGSAESAALTGVDGMTIAGTGLSVDVNRASILDASTLDFTGSSYAVAVGTGQSVALDYRGELVHAEGDITLNLLDFAWFNGHISFDQHSSSAPLTLKSSTGGSSTVSASSMMAITGSNITAFVGYADGGFDSGKTLAQQAGNLYGFGVEGVDLGVLMTKAGSQSYTAVKARMDSAALYGFDSTVFQLSADGIAFDYASADSSGKVIDYAKSFNGGVTLGAFGHTTIDFSSKKLGISTQNATLSIADSLYVKGAIGFQKEDFGTLKAGSTTVKSSKGFAIGGSNIDLFIGYAENGIDPEKPFALQAGSLYGFGAEGIDFGLMHFSGTGGITYTAAKAHADTVALYGFDPQDFQMSLKGIDLLFNTASSGSAINFKTSFAATGGYSVVTGGAPVLLDMTKETLGVSVNQATLRISDFVYLQGSFEFMKSSNLTLDVRKSVSTLYTGVKVEGFEIGASHVQAFVGIDGPYRSDTNSDGVITSADAVNPDAIGLFIDDLSFGMGVYKATNSLLNKVSGVAGTSFTALKATAATAGFVGVGNFLDLTPKDLRVTINQSSNATWLADFSSNRTIATGDTSSVVLDFSGSLLEASVGHAKANLAGLVSLEGGFTFQKRVLDRIGFNIPGLEVIAPADTLVIAGMDVQAFVGINGPYKTDTNNDGVVNDLDTVNSSAIGFAIENMDFAVALMSPVKSSGFAINGLKFFSLKASASLAGLVGTDPYLTLQGKDVQLSLNGAFMQGKPIPTFYADYTKPAGGGLHIPVGTSGREMVLDFDSNTIGLNIDATLGIFDLFDISQNFSFNFDLPSFDLGDLGLDLPTFTMPDFSKLSFGLSSFSFLKFSFPGFSLPELPNFDWSLYLGIPDLNLSLPSFTLPQLGKLFACWPTLKLQFPTFSLPDLPQFPDLPFTFTLPGLTLPTIPNFDWSPWSLNLGLPDLSLSLPSFTLPQLGKLYLNWPSLKVQFPAIDFPDLPALPTFSIPSLSLGDLKLLIAKWPQWQLDFPSINLPDLPAFPDFSIFDLPDIDLASLSIDLTKLGALFGMLPSLAISFPDIEFPDFSGLLPDFGITLPALSMPSGLFPSISLKSLTGWIPDLSVSTPQWLIDGLNFLRGIDISIGIDGIFGSLDFPDLSINIGDFVHVQGDFKLNLGQSFTADMATGLPSQLDLVQNLLGDTTSSILDLVKLGYGLSSDYSTLSNVTFKGVSFGASDASLFVGLGNPNFDLSLSEQYGLVGFGMQHLNLAIGSFQADLPDFMNAEKVLTLSAKADELGMYGFGDVLKVQASDITVDVNTGGKALGGLMRAMPIYSGIKNNNAPNGLRIATGGDPVYLNFNGTEIMGLDIGLAEITVADFMFLRGSLAFRKGEIYNVTVDTGGLEPLLSSIGQSTGTSTGKYLDMNVTALTLGGANLTGFAGVGGPYRYGDDLTGPNRVPDGLPDNINENAVGVAIDNVDFGLAIMTPTLATAIPGVASYAPKFISAKASIGTAALVGIDSSMISVKAKDVEVNINTFVLPNAGPIVNAALQLFGPPSINYKLSASFKTYTEDINRNNLLDSGEDRNQNGLIDTAGFMVPAGGNNGVFLDFTGEIIQVAIGYADINLAGFLQMSASMALTKKGSESVTLSNSKTTTVTTLALGISNANAFIGVPAIVNGEPRGYFYDSDGDGRIEGRSVYDESGTLIQGETDLSGENKVVGINESVIGLAIEHLDLGLVIAKESAITLEGIDIGVYLAGRATVQSIALVGVPGATLKAESIALEINIGTRFSLDFGQFVKDDTTGVVSYDTNSGVSVSFTTIDFSKSTWTDSKSVVHQGYGIATGNPDAPIVLDYKEQLLRVFGLGQVDLYSLVKIDGELDFRLSETVGLTAFVNGKVQLGPDEFSLKRDVTGLLVVNLDGETPGVAARFELNGSLLGNLDLGSFAKLDMKYHLFLNTFGKDITYVVPEVFRPLISQDTYTDPKTFTYTISAYPPGKDASWTGMYAAMSGNGSLSLLDGALSMKGDFNIIASKVDSEVILEMNAKAVLDLPVLEPLAVTGTIGFYTDIQDPANTGIYGTFNIGGDPARGGAKLLDISGVVTVMGGFLLQINTTGKEQKVTAIETDVDGNYKGVKTVLLASHSLHIAGAASLEIAGSVSMKGDFNVLVDKTGLQADLAMRLDLGPLGNLAVAGAIALVDDGGPIFALKATASMDAGIGPVSIIAGVTLEMNTSSTKMYAGVAAGTTFKIALDGGMYVAPFDISFKGEMSFTNDVFELKIDKADLNFFDAFHLSVSGYIRSDGHFKLTGAYDLTVDMSVLILKAGMSITIGDTEFAASIYGSLDVHLDLGLFEINETLAGFSGAIALTPATAYLQAEVTVCGISVGADHLWRLGPDPVIAHQDGSLLYLNMGDESVRYGSDIYDQTSNETYRISQSENGDVVVYAMGMSYIPILVSPKSLQGAEQATT